MSDKYFEMEVKLNQLNMEVISSCYTSVCLKVGGEVTWTK